VCNQSLSFFRFDFAFFINVSINCHLDSEIQGATKTSQPDQTIPSVLAIGDRRRALHFLPIKRSRRKCFVHLKEMYIYRSFGFRMSKETGQVAEGSHEGTI
jgi:hypothetical protein